MGRERPYAQRNLESPFDEFGLPAHATCGRLAFSWVEVLGSSSWVEVSGCQRRVAILILLVTAGLCCDGWSSPGCGFLRSFCCGASASIRQMIAGDRTYLSPIIALLYVATSLHCLWRTIVIAREGDAARRTGALIASGSGRLDLDGDAVVVEGAGLLPTGLVAAHIRDLAVKARLQGSRQARSDAAAARAGQPATRLQPVRRLRQRHADEAGPARHDHRLHHDAGADCGA